MLKIVCFSAILWSPRVVKNALCQNRLNCIAVLPVTTLLLKMIVRNLLIVTTGEPGEK